MATTYQAIAQPDWENTYSKSNAQPTILEAIRTGSGTYIPELGRDVAQDVANWIVDTALDLLDEADERYAAIPRTVRAYVESARTTRDGGIGLVPFGPAESRALGEWVAPFVRRAQYIATTLDGHNYRALWAAAIELTQFRQEVNNGPAAPRIHGWNGSPHYEWVQSAIDEALIPGLRDARESAELARLQNGGLWQGSGA